jgi:AraC-like DNA-binding protein
MLVEYCEDALSQRKVRRGSLRPRLENEIDLLLPHRKAHVPEISRRLGMSQRSLARRLSSEGLTFNQVLEELRADLARRYLQDAELPISEIAWLLGYTDASALTHAFHRWFGKTPREMRSRRELEYKDRARKTHRPYSGSASHE